jgi:peptide/nickel transport system substrate-binding protein
LPLWRQQLAVGAVAGGTLVAGVTAEPVTLDPGQALSTSDEKVSINIFDKLVQQEIGSYQLVPALAERWEVSPDGLTYTFHLRPGVKFHDETPFNADAAKFSFDRLLDEANPAHKMGVFPLAKSRLGVITAVQAVDETTLRIDLKHPFGPFIDYLGTAIIPMVSPTACKKLFTSFGQAPVGTGPFKFSRWDKGQRLVLERNPGYWGSMPKLERVISVTYEESQARITALRTGEAQLIEGLPPDGLAQIQRDPTLQLITGTSPHVWFVTLNNKFKPFSDARVRQALNYAVNKEALVHDTLRGLATVANGPLEPTIFAQYQTDLVRYPYDVRRAKQLLMEAGYPNGFDVVFSIPTSGQGMLEPVPMATFIQANLTQVGVRAKLNTYEWGAYQKVRLSGDFQMAAFSWTPGIGNPDIILYNLFHSSQQPPSGYNNAFWVDKTVDQDLDEARATTSTASRVGLYKDAQRRITAGVPMIFVCHAVNVVAASRKLQEFKVHPTTEFFFPPNVALG